MAEVYHLLSATDQNGRARFYSPFSYQCTENTVFAEATLRSNSKIWLQSLNNFVVSYEFRWEL